MKAVNILWDVDECDINYVLDNMDVYKAAEILGIAVEKFAYMNTNQRTTYANKVCTQCPSKLNKLMNLPDEVKIPIELKTDEGAFYQDEISDWLSDEYGYCHKGFQLIEELDIFFVNFDGKEDKTQIDIVSNGDDSIMMQIINTILSLQQEMGIKEVASVEWSDCYGSERIV